MPPPAVRTRRVSTVVPVPSTAGAPRRRRRVPLSPLDTRWVALPPMCQVFLFPAAAHEAQVPFSDVVDALSSSLAAVLPAFHPLAGEVAYSPELGTVDIVCGEDDDDAGGGGVAFVESETDLDFARLVADRDEDALLQLVPDIRREELPAPVFAAQVTEFVGGSGGIALGVVFSHVAMDGIGFFRFMEMWAASAVAAGAGSDGTEPPHDRRLVRFDGDEELTGRLLRLVAPDLPRNCRLCRSNKVRHRSYSAGEHSRSPHALRLLKQRLIAARPEFAGAAAPSTFATLIVHGWVSLALASGFTDAAPVFAVFASDCRAHMSPTVPGTYAGNCVASCLVALSGEELTGADGPALAFLAMRDAVTKAKQDPLLVDMSSLITKIRAIPPGRKVLVAGSPLFPAYAVDFGFGRPARVERASLDMAVYAGREAGSVQVSVAIAAEKMPAFHKMFAAKSRSNMARL